MQDGNFVCIYATALSIGTGRIGTGREVSRPMPTKKKTLRMHFSARLRAAREARGITQEAMALEAELHRTYVGQVERGERNVSIDNIEKLARAIGVDPEELMHGYHVAHHRNRS
jgi:ribosome-binding protein aMBF1 (putative translation factor)